MQQQQQQQQQRSSLFKGSSSTSNSNLFNLPTENRLDSLPIQIDSLNNNSYNQSNHANGGNNNELMTASSAASVNHSPNPTDSDETKSKRSLLNFRSFDFHIKSLYTGLRNKNSSGSNRQSGSNSTASNEQRPVGTNNRTPPYLRVEAVDMEESENLLLNYPQSPYSSRRNSEDNRSSTRLLQINQYEISRSQASSPYFLSPIPITGNIRRSSTSDIMCKRTNGESRRPSTSDLLRKARERKGSESSNRIGRSVSQGGLPRGIGRGGGGRRTSMAF